MPAGIELAFDALATVVARPVRPLRHGGCAHRIDESLRAEGLPVADHPELRPALDERDLAEHARETLVADETGDARPFEHVAKMGDLQDRLGSVDLAQENLSFRLRAGQRPFRPGRTPASMAGMNQTSPATLLSRRFPAKRAFVTGGASGLGLAMVRLLARDGWSIGILDVAAADLDRAAADLVELGARDVAAYLGDVAGQPFVAASVEAYADRHGGLDVLVNNAGVAVAGAIESTPVEDWHWIVGINLLGVAWGCRAAVPIMKRQGGGLILNVASSAGFASAPQMAPYNVTKAGVISLSETLVGELAGSGIQVSVAMPGFFRTHLLDHMRAPPEENRLAHRLMDHSGHDPDEAAAALLGAAVSGETYIVWPKEYRTAWRLKRWFPRWFLKRVQAFRDAQLRKADRPRG
jgi:NAD(P)-dependent dehydrogenase (short-subunit alcohol dehydrogenase family)